MLYALYGGVFWIPVVLALAGLGVVLLIRSTSSPHWMSGGASCGGCGYSIEQIIDGRCPECGASLVHVGVLTPRAAIRLRGSAFLLVTGWTLVITMSALPLLGVSFWLSQRAMNQQMMLGAADRVAVLSGTLVSQRPGQQSVNSQAATFEVLIKGRVETDAIGIATDGWVEFAFTNAAAGHTLKIQRDGSWVLRSPAGELRNAQSRQELDFIQLAQDMNLDPEDDTVLRHLEAVLREADDLFMSPQNYQLQMHSRSGTTLSYNGFTFRWDQKGDVFGTGLTPRQFAPLVTGLAILLVYGVGLWFFLRRRGRLLRAVMPR